MLLGYSFPVVDIGTGPTVVRDYVQVAEGLISVRRGSKRANFR